MDEYGYMDVCDWDTYGDVYDRGCATDSDGVGHRCLYGNECMECLGMDDSMF